MLTVPQQAQLDHPTLGTGITPEELVGDRIATKTSVYLDWLFAEPNRPALQTLRDIQAGVHAAILDISGVARL
jgi:hypothetical protein